MDLLSREHDPGETLAKAARLEQRAQRGDLAADARAELLRQAAAIRDAHRSRDTGGWVTPRAGR